MRPLGLRQHARDDVEGDKALGRLVVAIDREGDADAAEEQLGLASAGVEEIGRAGLEPLLQGRIGRADALGGLPVRPARHFIEGCPAQSRLALPCLPGKLRRKMRSRGSATRMKDGSMLDRYGYATHEVLNQPPPLADYDAYETDQNLRAIVRAFGAGWAGPKLAQAGRTVGGAHVQLLARQANRHIPELRTHDRFGNRVDQIEFHPAWHELMTLAMGQETHSLAWTRAAPRRAGGARRALLSVERGRERDHVPDPHDLRLDPDVAHDPDLARRMGAEMLSTRYDPRQIRAADKTGVTVGMAMTEKQGGSDLRQTQTVAERDGDGLAHRRAQMVLLGAAFGRFHHARPDRARRVLLRRRQAGFLTAAATGS